jgi:hypothetical protein
MRCSVCGEIARCSEKLCKCQRRPLYYLLCATSRLCLYRMSFINMKLRLYCLLISCNGLQDGDSEDEQITPLPTQNVASDSRRKQCSLLPRIVCLRVTAFTYTVNVLLEV